MLRYALVPCCLVFAACASAPPTKPSATPPAAASAHTGNAAVDALYARLDADTARYNAALDAVAHGDIDAGRAAIAAARGDLLDAADRCQSAPSCDGNRFIAAYDALLTRQARELNIEDFTENDDAASPAPAATAISAASATVSPVITNLPAAAKPVAMLKGRDLRDIITLNEPMKAALTEWLTSNRAQLIDAWENYQYMRQLMWPEYERAGLPEALLFGILAQESGGKVHAVSRTGAAGPLQFMPATGARYGLGDADGFDTRFDPTLATRANVQYLNERFAELGNNLELAIAAYNGGEGKVARLYAATGGKGFWDPEVYAQMSPETRDYVPRVLAAAWLFLNPKEYGLQFPRVNAGEPQLLTLARTTSLNELTICLGNVGVRDGWFRALRNLNPRYDPQAPIVAGTVLRVPPFVMRLYKANCLDNPARAQLAADLAAARKPVVIDPTPVVETSRSRHGHDKAGSYVARRGDTLGDIADRKDCDLRELARANGIRPPYNLRKGQKIRLVGCDRR